MQEVVRAPRFGEAFRFWLKLGFISFGGPAGQIAVMHRELVEHRRWISEHRFLHALNYCMLLPGPEAQQLATYIGWLLHGTAGGIVAGSLFVLPSLFVLMGLSWVYLVYGNLPIVTSVFYGIKPAVVAIVFHAAWRIGARALRTRLLWAVAGVAFVAIFALAVPFPVVVLGAAGIGLVAGRWWPQTFRAGPGHVVAGGSRGSALLDDHSDIPPHARFRWSRFFLHALVGVGLWGGSVLWLVAQFGGQSVFAQMAWFFTKVALLTFGGAYAVLPYVYQGAVEHYRWVTATQMIDGLALGETTPGPLIMVVAFVGFLGGWHARPFGEHAVVLAGVVGATVATVFTFLPSFLFILLGGPFVETTRGNLKFTAPLTAITAAVVGVIASLGLFFAGHVFWPRGAEGGVDAVAVALSLVAFAAMARFGVGVVSIIAGSAGAGAIVRWLAG